MDFGDRTEAAELLARELIKYKTENPLILAIPRGAAPMGKIVAEHLRGDLDVVLVHKIGAPDNPEFAIGSVSEFGTTYFSGAISRYGIPEDFVDQAAHDEVIRLKERRKLYSPIRPPISPTGRTVIIIDDGIATGATMLSAARAIRAKKPRKLIIAAPVASQEAAEMLRGEVDELVLLDTPEDFYSISQFYDRFEQVTDDEVLFILSTTSEAPHKRTA